MSRKFWFNDSWRALNKKKGEKRWEGSNTVTIKQTGNRGRKSACKNRNDNPTKDKTKISH